MTTVAAEISYIANLANRSPVLAREEETELARRFRDRGDERAADTLVRAHLRAVMIMATKHRHYGVPVSELIAEGNWGLVTALRRFDPERGVRFGTYAKHWVRAYILAYVIRSSNMLGGSSGMVRSQVYFKLRRERARITALFGEGRAADEALAERMNVSIARLEQLLGRLDSRSVSLDAPANLELPDRSIDVLAAAGNPEELYFHDQRRDVAEAAVAAALEILDPRERFIAEQRLMAAPADELSLAELGRRLGISRERARQLEERTLLKLRRSRAIRRNSFLNEWFAA
jgi:RNA polymerase sigma-32 factor